MQLARPEVGYAVVESTVESAQLMRHPVRRWLTTLTYLSVALMGMPAERAAVRRMVNRSRPRPLRGGSPAVYSAFDPGLQLWPPRAGIRARSTRKPHILTLGPAT